ncbi:16S rRNA (uracil(1498)-N(3))-methyltransferase [Herbiconiux moechotypicola]|uniref:Ribosomal RNA small subunit methyltransferase E n=1 Tax=Herbiconiux moechotypicola TaxID=637393 RepID=A0ABP5QGL0_9MICO|nr:16S rRNA (uracil(1498)-N(3))-methyltransferase [Herbiconiux moechotypicola]MCS5729872.1 16S rRNA (uracil(1498)-N(3))-methyltransferase [Herbiconiux moechotypicola]
MSSLFLRPDLAVVPHTVGDVVVLGGDEARHAATVNRLRVGEHTSVGDGNGLVVSGIVTRVEPKELDVLVEESVLHPEPVPRIVLVQALAKGDRDELAVQTATELGVSAVIPWQAERSVSRWVGAKAVKGVERWSTIVREAAKQSIRPFVPPVGDLVDTAQLLALAEGQRMLVLEPTAEQRLSGLRFDRLGDGSGDEPDTPPILLVVGPEGGISPRELDRLAEAGAQPVRLGDEVLRTSSAGPAALAVLNVALGRW